MKNNSSRNNFGRKNLSFAILTFLRLFQHSGDSFFLFPLFLILFFLGSYKITFWSGLVLAGMAFSGLLVWILKRVTRKTRPVGSEGQLYRKFDPYSFPSGHASRAFSIVAVLFSCNPHIAFGAAIWATFIALSRLKLKLHYWFDVVAGALVGAGTGLLVTWLSTELGWQ